LPLPFAPALMDIHPALLVAAQLHPAPAVTATLPVAAADVVRSEDAGEIENEQGVPACVTLNVWPPMVSVPVRDVVPELAATL
jgi:hypothetical protein